MREICFETIFATVAVVFGALLIAISIRIWNQTSVYLGKSLIKRVRLVRTLLCFFFFGYVWFLYVVLFDIDITKEFVVSSVFAAGGMFVFMQIKLFQDAIVKLKAVSTRHEVLFNMAGDSIFLIEGDGPKKGVIIEANKTAETMHGYSSGDLVGRHISVLDHKEDAHLVPGMLAELQRTGSLRSRIRHVRRDGSVFPVDVLASKLVVDGRECILAIDRDETDKVEAEELARSLQEQLAHTHKMQAVGTLASGIAHDFNNLLQGMLGYTEVLKDDAEPGTDGWNTLCKIESAAYRAADLVKNILNFSRLNPERFSSIHPRELVDEATDILGRTMPKMIKLEVEISAAVSCFHGDPTQLQQVLLNLSTNARDAMPYGGVLRFVVEDATLDAEFCQANSGAHPGDYVRISISDTGTGIEPEKIEEIFTPFFTTKAEGKGTGLGLSTVHSIVTKHDGYIQCNSELGKGTSFDIYLPVAVARKKKSRPIKMVEDLVAAVGGNILVVDDEDFVRDVVLKYLSRFGYNAFEAANGESALELLNGDECNIDLVLVDLNMPGMGGRACVSEIRKMSKDIKIILTTGLGGDAQVENVLKEGADKYLQKPYTAKSLAGAVGELLS